MNFDEMRSLEQKMDEMKSGKNEFGEDVINDWTVPSCAFITFESDDAKVDALRLVE